MIFVQGYLQKLDKCLSIFSRLVEDLGSIISAPIFFEISIFGIELALVLCQMETVGQIYRDFMHKYLTFTLFIGWLQYYNVIYFNRFRA